MGTLLANNSDCSPSLYSKWSGACHAVISCHGIPMSTVLKWIELFKNWKYAGRCFLGDSDDDLAI